MTWQLILIALCCTLEPIPLTGYILVLSTKNGTKNGFAFLVSWMLTLALVIGLTVGATGGKPPAPSTAPSNAILIAKIVLGVGLLIFAWTYRRRPHAAAAEPSWMKKMDKMTVPSAALLAFLLQPWGLVAGAALTITEADVSKTSDTATLVAFLLTASLIYVVMQAYVALSPVAARERLDGLRNWVTDHRTQMVVYLSVIVGALLITKGATALAS